MSLYKRGAVWWSRIVFNGQVFQRSTKARDKNLARKIESTWYTSLVKGEAGIPDHSHCPTLAQFEERLFLYLCTRVARRTEAFYEDAYKSLLQYAPLASTPMSKIDKAMIDAFVQNRLIEGYLPATVNNSLRTLRRALRLARDWKLISHVPKIQLLPGERQREFIITEEQLAEILAHEDCTPLLTLLLPFLVDTGLRITEACNLTWETVSTMPKPGAARGWVFVAQGKSKYARRYVPLTARAHAILEQCQKLSKGNYVFTGTDGKRKMSRHTVSEQFRQIRNKLKLPWDAVLHSCRHTFCTRLGESGADAFTIQKLAGHSSIMISQRYVHPTPERLESAIAMLESNGR